MKSVFSSVYDVAVVGSGPAGSSAALPLAKHGVKVAVLEKSSLPRYKTCGGAIVGRVTRLLPIDVQEVIECQCYSMNVNHLDAHLHFTVKRQQPIISMTMREKFDFFLVSAAKDAGADIKSKCQVLNLEMRDDKVQLTTAQGPVQARFVIAADGAAGVVAQKAGWQKHRHIRPALEYEVAVSSDELTKFRGVARFDLGLVPHGYAWVFPKKDHLSVGIGTGQRDPINLRKRLEQYFTILGLRGIKKIDPHGFFLPLRPRQSGFMRDRVLVVGDAAGFVDPFSGEGITFAIKSGQIAAKALLDAGLHQDQVKELYHIEINKQITPELSLGKVLAQLVHEDATICSSLFRLYGQTFIEQYCDVITGKINYSEMLLYLKRCVKQVESGLARP
jgi:geranylgeranyl reductase family protein